MKDATEEIVAVLSSRGFRITKARQEVIAVLVKQTQPVSVQEVCALIKKADEASVYRTIRMLQEEDILEEIMLQGQATKYSLSHGHHHHAVCTNCGFMEHVECKGEPIATAVPATFASVRSHEVTMYGLCKKCA
jgi:Fe2+ or Zn2+ uptake regulation protein